MQRFSQSPTDPTFVQNPYPVYAAMREAGPLVWWEDYAMVCATRHDTVHSLLRDRRFGREIPPEQVTAPAAHLAPFYAVEAHSMLELEPPRHTRLRGLVLRAFTSRRIKALGPEITALAHDRIDRFPAPGTPFDLLDAFCRPIPVIVICRLLGVPESMGDQLLAWSADMVAMYQARRDRAIEEAAARAATAFSDFLRDYIAKRETDPRDDLISHLIAARDAGDRLSADELITTCILLLNAGHEATVHSMGNGIARLLDASHTVTPANAEASVEEILRIDPPLHMFTRYAYEEAEIAGHVFKRGDQVALLLGSAGRDASVWPDPDRFDVTRPLRPAHIAFGGGLHFCVGAPLARLELSAALPVLFARCPDLRLAAPPRYADLYHFHGLDALMVTR
ncbi:cytochrome P450 [Cognatishimia sp. F0-27]|uniref:cytochrome P450 n=1 Tax=Cognatishimia sp. F0-27 TaxID=2816855 RepID=UPI001D0C506F|nr:cytochrome P450 [Cognatishimia sp. F0-27]MCC1492353.1 cytochrome P450 [Cognatishimia sp. F0-27]